MRLVLPQGAIVGHSLSSSMGMAGPWGSSVPFPPFSLQLLQLPSFPGLCCVHLCMVALSPSTACSATLFIFLGDLQGYRWEGALSLGAVG